MILCCKSAYSQAWALPIAPQPDSPHRFNQETPVDATQGPGRIRVCSSHGGLFHNSIVRRFGNRREFVERHPTFPPRPSSEPPAPFHGASRGFTLRPVHFYRVKTLRTFDDGRCQLEAILIRPCPCPLVTPGATNISRTASARGSQGGSRPFALRRTPGPQACHSRVAA